MIPDMLGKNEERPVYIEVQGKVKRIDGSEASQGTVVQSTCTCMLSIHTDRYTGHCRIFIPPDTPASWGRLPQIGV